MTTPHNPAPPAGYNPLTTAQEHAIARLIGGKPARDVTQAVGVTRATGRRWRHAQPGFIAYRLKNEGVSELWISY